MDIERFMFDMSPSEREEHFDMLEERAVAIAAYNRARQELVDEIDE